jgi:CheY-like chemotaxis protein
MSGDLISIRVLTALVSAQERALLRQACGVAPVPVEFNEAETVPAARGALGSGDFDIAFIDAAFSVSDRDDFIRAARRAKRPPFVMLVTGNKGEAIELSEGATADGSVSMPANIEQACRLIGRVIHVRLPSRVLVVDDSATMRGIVRKIMSGCRFPLEIAEAEEGIEALRQIASGQFDIVFLDYNMPGLNGIETLSEIKRQYPRLEVVLMTATPDEVVADRARAAGAAAFLKKPFYASDIDVILHSVYGLGTPVLSP